MKYLPQLLPFLFTVTASMLQAAPPTVSNVVGTQRVGTKIVDITYDLADPDTTTLTVSLQISLDSGNTWTVPVTNVTGHIGSGVPRGSARKITWNAGADWNNQYSTVMRFRVGADDSSTIAPVIPGFSYIPGGTFSMGDALGEGATAELPVHLVTLSPYFLAQKEVTFGEWLNTRTWGLANGYTLAVGEGKSNDHPVVTVSWDEAVKWCNAKSQRDGLLPCYYNGTLVYKTGGVDTITCDFTKNGYRLPTEAEWECGARGGLNAKRFPSGDTISHVAANYFAANTFTYDTSVFFGLHPAYDDGDGPHTSPVGAFAANGYGLYDMAGNAAEFCWDRHGVTYYADSPANNPRGPATGENRVSRGGHWNATTYGCRVADRAALSRTYALSYFGFRLARSNQ